MELTMKQYLEEKKQLMDRTLQDYIQSLQIPLALKESMLYSLEAGGKRLRPILLMASYEAFNSDVAVTLSSAAALEMIHTYSLIHDDLPAMDDDDYRRGKLTNHKAFNEATAILAGDALLTYSFELISKDEKLTAVQKADLIALLAEACGPKGMVAGQILDMAAEDKTISLKELEQVHALKTGELLRYAVYAGAYLGGATKEQLNALETFAFYLGLIFQVQDDILDVTGDQAKLGKPVGSDVLNLKSTYPKLLGLDGAMEQKEWYVSKVKEALEKADVANSKLMDLTVYFSQRDH
ncbi:polyprenyl synthetase family protein [Virgibacillus pantothenticus]|nr:farnesyl diphosphate synthase [Virgibacillus pantothenticus]MED3735962.1 polyprenyl synthetase family protein [Virgibacillus pantothenticus]SIS51862.1 farnesyl-diphosphate synthase [Virgibacillus pantothenticus]